MVGTSRLWLVPATALTLLSAGCASTESVSTESVSTESVSTESVSTESVSTEATGSPVLVTPCFETSPELSLPDDYIAADVSGNDGCLFILQAEGLADTTAIAGELFLSSKGRTFEQFVEQLEENLALGQEPDILALERLNTGATGRNLEIFDRRELDSPNRAVVFSHDSDRASYLGTPGLSAVVDAPPGSKGQTRAIIIWGFSSDVNDELIVDLIESIEFKQFK